MTHLTPLNRKAARILAEVEARDPAATPDARDRAAPPGDIVALQLPQQAPGVHIPLGCSFIFAPGWEADANGGTAGLCQPVERDLFDCHAGCFWPAHVPDQLNHSPDWTSSCAAAQKDWRKIDLVFP